MSIRKSLLCGALVGAGLACFLLLVVSIRPFPVEVNALLERAAFRLCPLYLLMFINLLRTTNEVILATILGNAVLYGILGVLLTLAYRLIRRSTGSVPR